MTPRVKWSESGEITGPIDEGMGAFIFGLRVAGVPTLFCCAGHVGKSWRPYVSFLGIEAWMIRLTITMARAFGYVTDEVCEIPPEPEWGWDGWRTAIYFQRRP